MRRREFIALVGGTAVGWPAAVRGEQPGGYRLAIVYPSGSIDRWNEAASPRYWRPFFEELRGQGFVEGQNLVVERYSGEGRTERYADLVQKVVASKPDAIYVGTDRMAANFKAASATIPIVASLADPVAFGLVSSLAHPGGNITGVVGDAGIEFYAKYLELLRQAVPGASRIAYLTPRAVWESPTLLTPVREAATQVGVSLIPALLEAPIREPEFRRVFAAMAQERADGLIVGSSSENNSSAQLIVELAENARLPTIYPGRGFAERGGLMAYGADYADLSRRAGADIAQILKGANPGDIPFYQASRFEFVINLKTAKALGLTLPQSLIARADEVIE